MSQKERDRLKVLTEARDKLITQKQAAERLKMSQRQIRRLVRRLRQVGDRAVLHGLRGKSSNRKIADEVKQRAIAELRDNRPCHDFGPSYASEHVRKQLDIQAGKDTVRKWMIDAGLWQARKRKVKDVHQWRPRRSCRGGRPSTGCDRARPTRRTSPRSAGWGRLAVGARRSTRPARRRA